MNAQAEIALCPECGRPIPTAAPEGLCPACLALTAVDEPAADPAHTPPDQPFANLRFYGDYELIRELGRGAMGVVHLAHQLGVNRPVALKLLVGGAAAGRDFIHRFHTEAATAARLDHPGIVPVYEFGTHDGAYYLAMKYLEGGTLADRLKAGLLEPPEIARIMIRIAQAVHYAHQHGVLHRDLKPGNILLDTDGQPYVADFGLARLLETDSTLTLSSAILGTAAYLAPEIARGGASQATTASDIHGLGAILYELLTSHPPFTGPSLADILRKVQEEEPAAPWVRRTEDRGQRSDVSDRRPEVRGPWSVVRGPSDLCTICLKCLEKEPAKRYPTAQALADDLERFLNDEPILARPVTRLERAWRWCRRKPALASAYGLLLLLLLLLSIASPIAAYRIDQARQEAVHQARQARLNQYVADINLAAEALQTRHSPGRARELLTGLIPETGEDLRGWEWHYLWGQVQSDATYTLGEHPDNIRSLALSPSGTLLASSDWGGAIGLWDIESRERLLLRQERQTVHQVQFYSDQILVAANASGSVTFHRVADGRLLHKIEVGAAVHAISLTPARDRLAALFSNNQLATVRVWHLRSADSPDVMLAIEPAYDLPTVREQRGWLGRNAVAFSPSGRQLSAGYSDGTIRIFDAAKGAELRRLVGHTQAIGSLAWSSDGRWLASGAIYGDHEPAQVWDTTTGEVLATLAVPQRTPRYVAFTRDDRYLLVARSGGNLQVWRTADWSLDRVLLGHEHHVNAIVTGPTVDTLFSGGNDRRILAWNLAQPSKQPATLELPGLRAFDWSPLGDVLATVEAAAADPSRRGVFIRATGNLQTRRELPELTDVPLDLAFSPDGQRLAVLTPESVSVMDVAAGRLHRTDPLPETGSTLIAGFTSDGEALLLLAPDLRVTVWDVRQGTVRHTWSARLDRPQWSRLDKWTVSFHARSGLLALTVNRCLSLWDTRNHAHLADLHGDTSSTVHPAFSSDGSLIVSADADGRINVWDARTLTLRQELRRLEDSAFSAAVSPDGQRVAVGRYRGEISTVTLVDIEIGRELLAIPGAPGLVRQLAWSPDGSVLLARMDEGRAWVIPPGSLRPDN